MNAPRGKSAHLRSRTRCCAGLAGIVFVIASTLGCADPAEQKARASISNQKIAIAHTNVVPQGTALPNGGSTANRAEGPPTASPSITVPNWAADAIFYQIFPERFSNGDKSNDPTRDLLESPDSVPKTWTI